jgi:hypothetical protein
MNLLRQMETLPPAQDDLKSCSARRILVTSEQVWEGGCIFRRIKQTSTSRQSSSFNRCYNGSMTSKNQLKEYKSRWSQVESVVQAERRSASPLLRWQQLNSAYAMAKGLGLVETDPSEMEVFRTWARLKEKAASQNPKA